MKVEAQKAGKYKWAHLTEASEWRLIQNFQQFVQIM